MDHTIVGINSTLIQVRRDDPPLRIVLNQHNRIVALGLQELRALVAIYRAYGFEEPSQREVDAYIRKLTD